ncbi:MAG: alpha-amylase family glycosyl hydrolase [Mycoplasmatales bacterium]
MIIYEIYVRSFNDSNDDLIGDFNGVIEKLDYLSNLGIEALWLTPFYPSPLVDNGYDVADYVNIDERIGNLADFKQLTNEAHSRNLKVIIDVVFNHTSDQHEWFKRALAGEQKYQAYYHFYEQVPNNWQSMFKGSAWSYAPSLKQYYLHRFAKEQPDLNLANSEVLEELKAVLNFWLEQGVDGFRFDVINFLISDPTSIFKDNPYQITYLKNTVGKAVKEYEIAEVKRQDINQRQTLEVIKQLRTFVTAQKFEREIIFIGEVGSTNIEVLASYVGTELMDFVFTFNLSSLELVDMEKFGHELEQTYKRLANPTIFFSSHDMSRFYRRICKYDDDLYEIFLELIFALKGTKILFQGDETKTVDFECQTIDEMQDIQSLNEYHLLCSNGILPEQAFKQAMKNNRDFSRNFPELSKNQSYQFVKDLIGKYNTAFYQKADIKIKAYTKEKLVFERFTTHKIVTFEFCFKEKQITIK